MKKDELLIDPLWNLETASVNLKSDIDFLNCVEDEFFSTNEQIENNTFFYYQLSLIVETLRKSMQWNYEEMKKSIEAIYNDTIKK